MWDPEWVPACPHHFAPPWRNEHGEMLCPPMGACSLLAESPSLTLPQGAHALRKLTAEAVDVVVRVDVIARTTPWHR